MEGVIAQQMVKNRYDCDSYHTMCICLYFSWFYVGSLWKYKDIPVAVVNHDQKVFYENEMLDVGNDFG